MSTETALTMEELELETAELLPSRETLCGGCHCGCFPHVTVILVVGLCL
jgi:hypothetical protein